MAKKNNNFHGKGGLYPNQRASNTKLNRPTQESQRAVRPQEEREEEPTQLSLTTRDYVFASLGGLGKGLAYGAALGIILGGVTYFYGKAREAVGQALVDTATAINTIDYNADVARGKYLNELQESARSLEKELGEEGLVERLSDARNLADNYPQQVGERFTREVTELERTLGEVEVDLKQATKKVEEYQTHYDTLERTKVYFDKALTKLLEVDDRIDDVTSKTPMGKVDDLIRRVFGKAHGEEGKRQRKAELARLQELCKVYETNEDNLRAQQATLEDTRKTAGEISNPEVKKMYQEVAQYMADKIELDQKYGRDKLTQDELRKANEEYSGKLRQLRETQERVKGLVGRISQNRDSLQTLQGLLDKGITKKRQLRAFSGNVRNYIENQDRINQEVKEIREELDYEIEQLEDRGIEVQTKAEIVRPDWADDLLKRLREERDSLLEAAAYVSAGFAGLVGFLSTGRNIRRKKKFLRKVEREIERRNR